MCTDHTPLMCTDHTPIDHTHSMMARWPTTRPCPPTTPPPCLPATTRMPSTFLTLALTLTWVPAGSPPPQVGTVMPSMEKPSPWDTARQERRCPRVRLALHQRGALDLWYVAWGGGICCEGVLVCWGHNWLSLCHRRVHR